MIAIPIETANHTNDMVLVVLFPENIERMKVADPAEIVLRQTRFTLVNPTVIVCLEDDRDSSELAAVMNGGDPFAIGRYLSRGFRYRPDKGDHDRGPESILGG